VDQNLCIGLYTPLSGVPCFPIPRSANSDSPLKHHDLYGKQQLRRRCRAPLDGNSPVDGTPLKGVYTVLWLQVQVMVGALTFDRFVTRWSRVSQQRPLPFL